MDITCPVTQSSRILDQLPDIPPATFQSSRVTQSIRTLTNHAIFHRQSENPTYKFPAAGRLRRLNNRVPERM